MPTHRLPTSSLCRALIALFSLAAQSAPGHAIPTFEGSAQLACAPGMKARIQGQAQITTSSGAGTASYWMQVGLKLTDLSNNSMVFTASNLSDSYASPPLSLVAGRGYRIEFLENNNPATAYPLPAMVSVAPACRLKVNQGQLIANPPDILVQKADLLGQRTAPPDRSSDAVKSSQAMSGAPAGGSQATHPCKPGFRPDYYLEREALDNVPLHQRHFRCVLAAGPQ